MLSYISFNNSRCIMAFRIIRKFVWHALIGITIWIVVRIFSPEGDTHGGWIIGFLGSCYIFAAWLNFLKSRRTDFFKLFKRKKKPEVPFYLRGVNKCSKTCLTLNGIHHDYDDDTGETKNTTGRGGSLANSEASETRFSGIAWLACGIFFIILSAF